MTSSRWALSRHASRFHQRAGTRRAKSGWPRPGVGGRWHPARHGRPQGAGTRSEGSADWSPYLYGLAVNGAEGVAKVVNILRDEFQMAMAMTGRPDIRSID